MSTIVYWMETSSVDSGLCGSHDERTAMFKEFEGSEISPPLKFAEELRARRKQGERISHIDIKTEMTESVGQDGVGDAPKDYDWYKRRVDPSIKLGRNSGDEIEVDLL